MGIAPIRIIGLENDGAGFTPVRRRVSTINIRQHQTDPGVEWTATRCNRLLRALTSRIAILKKDLARHQDITTARSQMSQEKPSKLPKRNAVDDVHWAQGKKRVRRTYSGRGGGTGNRTNSRPQILSSVKETRNLIPGEIDVPTPVLNRARGDIPAAQSPIAEILHQQVPHREKNRIGKRPKTKHSEAHLQLSEMMRGMRRQIPAGRYTTYEGIYNGMETLLRVTASSEPNVRCKGARSLLSMCLVVVPRYIAEEEALLETQLEETGERSAIKNRDISTEIYDDLEAFGSFGRGWKQLRIIVRSHGVRVVSDAIKAGLLDMDFCGILVTLCSSMGAAEEGQTLLSSALSVRKVHGPRSVFSRFGDDEQCRPLSLLSNFVEERQCFSFQYRELSKMVSNDLLPLSWVATKEFGPIWTRAIQALSSYPTNADAVIFMETVLSNLADLLDDQKLRKPKEAEDALFEATKQTFSSLLTTLVSIVILSKETTNQVSFLGSEHMDPKYQHILSLLRGSLTRWKLSSRNKSHGTLLLLVNLIIGNWSNGNEFTDLDLLIENLRYINSPPRDPSRNDFVAFVCSVARCCGRGACTLGFEYLEHLHLLLGSLTDSRESNAGRFLDRMIVDSAFEFAHQAPGRKHREYAAKMEEKFQVMKTKVAHDSTPGNAQGIARIGFRWEEGISEWVTATPTLESSKSCPQYNSLNGLESDTRFRPSIRRKMNKEVAPQSISSPGPEHVYTEAITSSPTFSTSNLINLDDTASDGVSSPSQRSMPCRQNDGGDEIIDTTYQSRLGLYSDNVSEDKSFTSPIHRQDLYLEETFLSEESSSLSCSSSASSSRRPFVDKAPRLSRRVLQHGLQWQLFDESDDELGFQSTCASQGGRVLRDITNTNIAVGNTQRGRKVYASKRQKLLVDLNESLTESEDELCM